MKVVGGCLAKHGTREWARAFNQKITIVFYPSGIARSFNDCDDDSQACRGHSLRFVAIQHRLPFVAREEFRQRYQSECG